MAYESFTDYVQQHSRNSLITEWTVLALRDLSEALKTLKAAQSVDSRKKYQVDSGATSIAELEAANSQIERKMTKLLNGRSSASDAKVLKDLMGHGVNLLQVLPNAAANYPGVSAFVEAEAAAERFNTCAVALDEMNMAFDAGKSPGHFQEKLATSTGRGRRTGR